MAPKKKAVSLGRLETMALDTVKPYWRNPRRVTDEAVNMLVESMRQYGYQQPIVVDEERVIIVGHTRYAALRRMGVTEVPILIAESLTPEQVKQYRLIDNRSGEFSEWAWESLVEEMSGMDATLATVFFPEIGVEEVDALAAETTALEHEWGKVDSAVEFVCPSCFHSWETEVTKADVMAGVIRSKEEQS